jgi:hypothetical protein
MSHRRGSWAKYQTEEGYEYYYDEDTRNSQWERPCDYSSDQEEAAALDPVEGVTEGEDTTQTYLSTNEILLEEYPQGEYSSPSANQQETAVATEQYYEDTSYEDFFFEYDATATLFDELARLTLFQPLPPLEISSLRSGHWCHISCRKLEVLVLSSPSLIWNEPPLLLFPQVLQMCLENYGTEEEWKAIFCYNDWIAMRYLMKFMHPA